MNLNQVSTQRSDDGKFCHDGFMYVRDKVTKDGSKMMWRCDKKDSGNKNGRKGYCNGRIWTNIADSSFHCLRTQHSCSNTGNAVRVAVQQITTNAKSRAVTTMENAAQIRAEIMQDIPRSVLGQLPTVSAFRKLISNKRKRVNVMPANPENRESIIIGDDYMRYEWQQGQYENFLLADSGVLDPNRVMIFGREYNATWAEQMQDVFMDGTFLLSPPLFCQIFVILARRGNGHGHVFPILYCLLPNKLQVTYTKMFHLIKTMWPQFNPESINVDYELAIHQALWNEFPQSNIKGCFFHLIKNLRKHLSEVQLLSRYNTDPDFSLQAKMITSIAFLPEGDVIEALTMLENELPDDLEPVLAWFTNVYVGRLRNNGVRAPPTYPYAIWSVYQRTLDGADRTNNFAEAVHKKMQLYFGVNHPTLWKFLDSLKKLQKTIDADYELFVAGHEATNKRLRYVEADRRIHNKVVAYDRNNILEYLRGLSHNYHME